MTDPELMKMNEAQLVFQAYALVEKKKRTHIEELEKFFFLRESIIDLLGTRVDAEPNKFEVHGHEFSKTHSLPFIYLTAPILGPDNIQSLLKSYRDGIKAAQEGVEKEIEVTDSYEALVQLIADGYETDEIAIEMTGKDVETLIYDKWTEDKNREVDQLSVTKDEFEAIRRQTMEETPINKKKKPAQFNIKLGD